ncbi:MAG: hypothetical protein P4L84_32915 [Isosphaeraceae bacterium]|nr:hypothetical protein [Isosphaeraceae bacterium]
MSTRSVRSRRGAVIVPVLVCFVLIMLICAGLVQLLFTERGITRQEERRLQAEWLAEAGLERAAARLSRARGYTGESWEVPAQELGGQDAGQVVITVETPKDEPGHRRVIVRADYPLAAERRARRQRTLVIDLGPDPSTGDKS